MCGIDCPGPGLRTRHGTACLQLLQLVPGWVAGPCMSSATGCMFLHFASCSGAESIDGGVPSSRINHFCAVHVFYTMLGLDALLRHACLRTSCMSLCFASWPGVSRAADSSLPRAITSATCMSSTFTLATAVRSVHHSRRLLGLWIFPESG